MVAEYEIKDGFYGDGFRASKINEKVGFWHMHPEVEIVLNLKSYGTRIIGDSVELFDKHDLTMVSGNLPHSWNHYNQKDGIPDDHGIVCHFRADSIGDKLMSQHEFSSFRRLLAESERGLTFPLEDAKRAEPILTDMTRLTGLKKMVSFFSLMELLASSAKRKQLCSEDYRRAFDDRGNRRLVKVYSYIRENYSKQVSLKKLADIADMSPFAFSRFFKRNSGAGLVEYINQVRTNKACYLLRETDETIADIADECGFKSISNFNKQFRRYTSLSPRDYRMNYR